MFVGVHGSDTGGNMTGSLHLDTIWAPLEFGLTCLTDCPHEASYLLCRQALQQFPGLYSGQMEALLSPLMIQ